MSEIDLSDSPVVEIASRDEVGHELVRDALDAFNGAGSVPRLAVSDEGRAPTGPGWSFLFRVRVRIEDGLDLLHAVSDAAPGSSFNIR